jgi:hypothetical protein
LARKIRVVRVSYEEAQHLIPVFEFYAKEGPWQNVRRDAAALLRDLRNVRDIDYSPLYGKQIFLTEEQYDFFMDARAEMA